MRTNSTREEPANLGILRGEPDQRVNLGNTMRQGDVPEQTPGIDVRAVLYAGKSAFRMTREEEEKIYGAWSNLKVEREDLTGRCIQRAWQGHFATVVADLAASPIGLGTYVQENGERRIVPLTEATLVGEVGMPRHDLNLDVDSLRRYSVDVLSEVVSRWVRAEGNDNPAYLRLSQIVNFADKNFVSPNHSGEFFITRGIETAMTAMWGVLAVIPDVYLRNSDGSRTITRSELRTIIKNSLPLVMHLAAGNVARSINLLEALENTGPGSHRLDPKHFMLVDSENGPGLRITQRALDTLRDWRGTLIAAAPLTSVTTGCPAIPAKGESGQSVIVETWRWFLSVAEKTYLTRFEDD